VSVLIDALTTRHALPVVDATSIDAFLVPAGDEPAHALLFFTGDPLLRAESNDVAVVLPELLAAFAPALRAAIVARDAEAALAPRFHVAVYPSLVLTRLGAALGVMPRIRDWADYVATIRTLLAPAATDLPATLPPRVEIRHVKHGSAS
jgi:hydrogenase-1 operon protein HyaE